MFKLLHLTDPHFGAANQVQADAIVAIANDIQPDLTLISGDFSMRARKREMIAAKQWLSQLPEPQLTIPGNHDVPLLNQLFDRFFRPFRRYKKYICETLEPNLDIEIHGKLSRILTFNSSTPFGLHLDWSRGFISPFQGERIETGFDDLEDATALRIVVFHHPLHRADDSTRVLVSPAQPIKNSLAKANADLLLAGHFHQSYSGVMDLNIDDKNLVISQASTACSTRTKGEPAGFHLLHLDADTIHIDQYTWLNDKFQKVNTSSFKKLATNWTRLDSVSKKHSH